MTAAWASNAWAVLLLYLIPVGGGIPAGVLLAKSHGISWPFSALLYLISDVILACIFDPLMHLVIAGGKRSKFLARFGEALKKSAQKSTSHYGNGLGPLSLIMIAFGVDPMTGRAATHAAGHGFVSGWTLSIIGDMLYFFLLMASTLWLNGILGDETRTTLIILVAMMIGPALIKRVREYFRTRARTS